MAVIRNINNYVSNDRSGLKRLISILQKDMGKILLCVVINVLKSVKSDGAAFLME